jgi:hypothetical protein
MPKENYEVTLRDKRTGNRRSLFFAGTSFKDVEDQITDGYNGGDWATSYAYFDAGNEEIIRIDKEYDATSTDA